MATLSVNVNNPRYFDAGDGKALLLTGSHFWYTQTNGSTTNPPPEFDFTEWLDFLVANGHNFMRGWMWEQTRNAPGYAGNYYFDRHVWARSSTPGHADGGNKFDLTTFNQDYFDTLRARIIEAGNRGIYYSVMLFQGWSIYPHAVGTNPWTYHPMKSNNNINGINGDPSNTGNGRDTQNLGVEAVTTIQQAMVNKFIDELNDLDNIFWEIGNELWSESSDFQEYWINHIRAYEAGKPKQHLIWYTGFVDNGFDSFISNSTADVVSLKSGYSDNMPANDGTQWININDSDHVWGIDLHTRAWYWKSFCRGLHPVFMDTYDGTSEYFSNGYNLSNPSQFISIRQNLGYILSLANRSDLVNMTPQSSLSSTSYCLAKTSGNVEYIVYQPSSGNFTVNLTSYSGELQVEWINPTNGAISTSTVIGGSETQSFTNPFAGDAILHLYVASQAFVLSASTNIGDSGQVTTALLTAPAGKTTGDFQAGQIADDENPHDAIDLTSDKYTEIEWSIQATDNVVEYEPYEFRVTSNGTILNLYSQTPQWTVQPTPAFMLVDSVNIGISGEATTALLTPPAGKTTSDFTVGRMQDDESPTDAIDIATDQYTELEWSLLASDDALDGSTYEFRVTQNGTPLNTYTQTPQLTIGANPAFSLSASANITASGENTTALLTAPAGKTTGDFVAGRLQDDENPTDLIDITINDYTEVEWCIKANDDAEATATYQFRVTDNGTAIDTYTVDPRWTIGSDREHTFLGLLGVG